jgi:hypothetical protein
MKEICAGLAIGPSKLKTVGTPISRRDGLFNTFGNADAVEFDCNTQRFKNISGTAL